MLFIKFVLNYYNKLPIALINAMAPIYRLMPEALQFTPTFIKERKRIERIRRLTSEELCREENRCLGRLVRYAYEHTEYYRELFDKAGIDPNDINTVKDIEKIPFLTKELLIENRDRMISDEFKKEELIYITTSGTMGTPTGFFVQKDSHIRDWAYTFDFFGEFGYNTKCSKLMLRGKVFHAQKRGKAYQWDAVKKELSVNIFDMTPQNMEKYCQLVEKYKPDVAYGYMSAMYMLCKYISGRKIKLNHKFKCFIGISETITDEQKQFVESVIHAPVFTFYGMSERVIIAKQLYESGEYIPEPLYGITELVDKNGNIITEKGVEGELVGTSLLNYGMPLIRYKTGDISRWSRERVLKEISGRWDCDLLVGKEGCGISMTALNMHSEVFKRVRRYQLEQNERGRADILIVPGTGFNEEDRIAIERQFNEKTKGQLIFSSKIVEKIMPKKNGKVPLVKQNLDLKRELEIDNEF